MPAPYNETIMQEISFWNAPAALNSVSGGLLFSVFFVVIWLIIVISFKDTAKGFLVGSSAIMSFLALIGVLLEYVNWSFAVAPILCLFGSLILYGMLR